MEAMRLGFGAIVLVLLATGLAAPAPAGEAYGSKVTIGFNPGKRVDFFSGDVGSSEASCVQGRKVLLYKQRKAGSVPKQVGSDFADGGGLWSVEHAPNGRFFFAKVKEKTVPAGLCRDDRSPKLEFSG